MNLFNAGYASKTVSAAHAEAVYLRGYDLRKWGNPRIVRNMIENNRHKVRYLLPSGLEQ